MLAVIVKCEHGISALIGTVIASIKEGAYADRSRLVQNDKGKTRC
jgi:hypothetical protein